MIWIAFVTVLTALYRVAIRATVAPAELDVNDGMPKGVKLRMMKNALAWFAVTSISAAAQDHAPVSSITSATWAQYRGDYQQSPLCGKDEVTLWSCETGKRVYSLCSSRAVTRTSGHMQYRASDHGKIVLTYPAEKRPPLGVFVYNSYGSGDASVDFTNNGYGYTLFDALRGNSSIRVVAPAPSGKQSEVKCGGNQTLQLNYSMRLMYDSGVWTGY